MSVLTEDDLPALMWAARLAAHIPDCSAVPQHERNAAGFTLGCMTVAVAIQTKINQLKTGQPANDQSGHHH